MSDIAIEVTRLLGGCAKTAEFFGVTAGAVSQWCTGDFPAARELFLFKTNPEIYISATRAVQAKEPNPNA